MRLGLMGASSKREEVVRKMYIVPHENKPAPRDHSFYNNMAGSEYLPAKDLVVETSLSRNFFAGLEELPTRHSRSS